jgi:hypothetical protein
VAIDQREELIAKVRAQVEKEKAEKAAKLKKEQEARQLSGNASASTASSDNKPKFKTLSQEELAKIEEKKRRKLAAEKGIVLEEDKPKEEKPAEEKTAENATEKKEEKSTNEDGLGMSVGIQHDKDGKTLSNPLGNGAGLSSGLGSGAKKEEKGGKSAGLGIEIPTDNKKNSEKDRLKPTKLSGSDGNVTVIGDEEEPEEKEEEVLWTESEASKKNIKNVSNDGDDIVSIVPNRKTAANDV